MSTGFTVEWSPSHPHAPHLPTHTYIDSSLVSLCLVLVCLFWNDVHQLLTALWSYSGQKVCKLIIPTITHTFSLSSHQCRSLTVALRPLFIGLAAIWLIYISKKILVFPVLAYFFHNILDQGITWKLHFHSNILKSPQQDQNNISK